MEHRHLNHVDYTTAAVDDIIARGGRADWAALRDAATADKTLLHKILRVCAPHQDEPYAQRYHVWRHYAARRIA
jgi:hypothetical protein